MATGSAARITEPARPQSVPPFHRVRVLRWTYRRHAEQLRCELSLTADLSAYELRVYPARFAHSPASEVFEEAVSALERQTTFERALIRDGWHLDQFEHSV